jgi:large subunit ribosomal protein L35
MKQKTKKAAKKRFSFSSTGKVKHRAIGQAHFNARSNGSETRRKHHDRPVNTTDLGRIETLLPYN